MGVELDPTTLSEPERQSPMMWIALHKRLRPLLHAGEPLALPAQAGRSALGVVAANRRQAALLVAQERTEAHRPPPLAIRGLDPARRYRLQAPEPQRLAVRMSASQRTLFEDGLLITGAPLGTAGLALPELQPETALVLELNAAN